MMKAKVRIYGEDFAMIFDTHAHYDDERFDGDRDALLKSLPENGVAKVVNVGASMDGARATFELMKKYSHVYGAIGVHPDEVGELEKADAVQQGGACADGRDKVCAGERGMRQDQTSGVQDNACMRELRAMLAHEKAVAVGEIGLDYHWNVESRETQKKWFIEQMKLALECGLPIVVHSREAAQDTFDCIREHHAGKPGFRGGIIHCYSGSVEMAREYVKLGYFIGIGGVVTFKNARVLKEVAADVPLARIVVETDCPYLAPEPRRGERNSSLYLPYIIEEIARVRGLSAEEVERATYGNAMRVYRMAADEHMA